MWDKRTGTDPYSGGQLSTLYACLRPAGASVTIGQNAADGAEYVGNVATSISASRERWSARTRGSLPTMSPAGRRPVRSPPSGRELTASTISAGPPDGGRPARRVPAGSGRRPLHADAGPGELPRGKTRLTAAIALASPSCAWREQKARPGRDRTTPFML